MKSLPTYCTALPTRVQEHEQHRRDPPGPGDHRLREDVRRQAGLPDHRRRLRKGRQDRHQDHGRERRPGGQLRRG